MLKAQLPIFEQELTYYVLIARFLPKKKELGDDGIMKLKPASPDYCNFEINFHPAFRHPIISQTILTTGTYYHPLPISAQGEHFIPKCRSNRELRSKATHTERQENK